MLDTQNRSSLEKAIISTLCYFDIFNFPLTLLEVWKWLYFGSGLGARGTELGAQNLELLDVQKILENSSFLKEKIEQKRGFYFLKGKEKNIDLRLAHYNLAEKKFKKALRIAKLFRFHPFVKMMGICNSLAFSNALEESDIDFFIVTKPKRIWTARFFTSLITKLLRLRPTLESTKDKICLTFFVTENVLNLEKLKFTEEDPYLTFWVSQVEPIYDPQGIYQKFWEANKWIKKYLPNALPNQLVKRRKVYDSALVRLIRKAKELVLVNGIGNLLEKILKRIQLKVLPDRLKSMANQDSRVVIRDDILKFHDNDRRREIEDLFLRKIDEIIGHS